MEGRVANIHAFEMALANVGSGRFFIENGAHLLRQRHLANATLSRAFRYHGYCTCARVYTSLEGPETLEAVPYAIAADAVG